MFKTQISRIVAVVIVAFFAANAFLIFAIAGSGRPVLVGDGKLAYGWDAAGELALAFFYGYLGLAIIIGLCWLGWLWIKKGQK